MRSILNVQVSFIGTEPAADVTLFLSPNPTPAQMECICSNPIGRALCVPAEHGRSIERRLVRCESPFFKESGLARRALPRKAPSRPTYQARRAAPGHHESSSSDTTKLGKNVFKCRKRKSRFGLHCFHSAACSYVSITVPPLRKRKSKRHVSGC